MTNDTTERPLTRAECENLTEQLALCVYCQDCECWECGEHVGGDLARALDTIDHHRHAITTALDHLERGDVDGARRTLQEATNGE